jgi:hypothetical protein
MKLDAVMTRLEDIGSDKYPTITCLDEEALEISVDIIQKHIKIKKEIERWHKEGTNWSDVRLMEIESIIGGEYTEGKEKQEKMKIKDIVENCEKLKKLDDKLSNAPVKIGNSDEFVKAVRESLTYDDILELTYLVRKEREKLLNMEVVENE